MKLPLREEVVLNWFVQICFAVKYIHDRKIMHRDLKLANILIHFPLEEEFSHKPFKSLADKLNFIN